MCTNVAFGLQSCMKTMPPIVFHENLGARLSVCGAGHSGEVAAILETPKGHELNGTANAPRTEEQRRWACDISITIAALKYIRT